MAMCWAHGGSVLADGSAAAAVLSFRPGPVPLLRHPGGPRSREVPILTGGPHIDADTLSIGIAPYGPELLGSGVPQPQPPRSCLLKLATVNQSRPHPTVGRKTPLLYGGVQARPSHPPHLCISPINTRSRGEGPPLLYLQHNRGPACGRCLELRDETLHECGEGVGGKLQQLLPRRCPR